MFYTTILTNFIPIEVNSFLSFFLRAQILLPYKGTATANALYILFFEISGLNLVEKCRLEFQIFEKILLMCVEYVFHRQ